MSDSGARLVTTIAELRAVITAQKRGGSSIGFVPTMGALHSGHASLMEAARGECAFVVVSVFVNPTQFNNKEDYAKYARTLPHDMELCSRMRVDVVFAPSVEEMYPGAAEVYVETPETARFLCGEYRPGHFRGVATVVAKLFNIVQPDVAYFGQKDAQQLAVIRQMVRELNFPIAICGLPTVREADGLALSSRNERLTIEERRIAPVLYRALQAATESARAGVSAAQDVREAALRVLRSEPAIRVEYFEIVEAERMHPVQQIEGTICIAVAAWLGSVRLIDNVLVEPRAA